AKHISLHNALHPISGLNRRIISLFVLAIAFWNYCGVGISELAAGEITARCAYYSEGVRKFQPRIALWQPWGKRCIHEQPTLKGLRRRSTFATLSELQRILMEPLLKPGFQSKPWLEN